MSSSQRRGYTVPWSERAACRACGHALRCMAMHSCCFADPQAHRHAQSRTCESSRFHVNPELICREAPAPMCTACLCISSLISFGVDRYGLVGTLLFGNLLLEIVSLPSLQMSLQPTFGLSMRGSVRRYPDGPVTHGCFVKRSRGPCFALPCPTPKNASLLGRLRPLKAFLEDQTCQVKAIPRFSDFPTCEVLCLVWKCTDPETLHRSLVLREGSPPSLPCLSSWNRGRSFNATSSTPCLTEPAPF